jgi:hypothetical protein
MKKLAVSILLMAAFGSAAFGQQWEFGGMGGGTFLDSVTATGAVGAATAGFQTGFAAGAFFGQNLYRHISGELRYGFLQSDLSLKGGGSQASFKGVSHVVHYDLILHTNRRGSRAQLFVALGGGMRIFRGTGTEEAYQPLSQFGYFTKTQALKPMASVGAGVRWSLTGRLFMRAEFRDYITMFPKEIITPAPGMKYGNLLHDLVPMVGISYEF